MNLHARQDLHLAVDDHGLALQHLAVDLLHGERHVAASGRTFAATGIGIDRSDVRFRIVERPLDPLELLALNIKHGIRQVGQLAGVIPVGMADHHLGDIGGIEAEYLELIRQRSPVLRPGHLQIFLLLPAGIVEDQLTAALYHADIHRQIDGRNVVFGLGAAGHEGAIRHEHSERHIHETTALDQPYRADRLLSLRRHGE
jgi:hypothetical protein